MPSNFDFLKEYLKSFIFQDYAESRNHTEFLVNLTTSARFKTTTNPVPAVWEDSGLTERSFGFSVKHLAVRVSEFVKGTRSVPFKHVLTSLCSDTTHVQENMNLPFVQIPPGGVPSRGGKVKSGHSPDIHRPLPGFRAACRVRICNRRKLTI